MKRIEIFIIFGLILYGLLTHSGSLKPGIHFLDNFFNEETVLFNDSYQTKSFELLNEQFTEISKLTISNKTGTVEILQSADEQVHLAADAHMLVGRKDQTNRISEEINIIRQMDGQHLRISTQYDQRFQRKIRNINFRVAVPKNMDLHIHNGVGNLKIANCQNNLILSNTRGETEINNINGDVELDQRHGSVTVSNINGQVIFKGVSVKAELKELLSCQLDCSHSRIFANNIANELAVKYSGFSLLRIYHAANVTIQARHSKVIMENCSGTISIVNSHNRIDLKKCSGNISIAAKVCSVRLDSIQATVLKVENKYNSVKAENISGSNLEFILDKSNLQLQVISLENRLLVDVSKGNIDLKLPQLTNPKIMIDSKAGSIDNQSGFDLETKKNGHSYQMSLMGSIPEIVIKNSYGRIIVRK